MVSQITPSDGLEISADAELTPGTYVLPRGLTITADNVTISGQGVRLISPTGAGAAISARGRRGLTIRDMAISGYQHGIRLDDCADVTIENVTVRGTAEIVGIDTFLYLWQPIEQVYGGAILLNRVSGGLVRGCDVQHQMDGMLLYGCSGLTVEHNNASFNSGWGVYLAASSDNIVQDNQLDFCNRLYRRPEDRSVRAEADAAAIVLVFGSSRNQFRRNSCIGGGDGIFVAGYRHPGDIQPCNDNLFEDNDCRLSPNNAVEATFSRGNIFRRNDCSRSNYGFWMGFSWDTVIEDNTIEFNRWTGIAAEHAHDLIIRNNRIRLNGDGVRLWTRGGVVVPYWPGHEVTYNVTLEDNLIEQNISGFVGYTGAETTVRDCHHFHLKGNTFHDNRVGAQFKRVTDSDVSRNTFAGNIEAALRLIGQPDVLLQHNTFEGNAQDVAETKS